MDLRDMSVSLDELIAQFGDYYLDSGQNMSNLKKLPFELFGTADAGTLWPTNDTVVRNAKVRNGKILQPYQNDFTGKGELKSLPVAIFLHHVKIDTAIIPNDFVGTWAQFLADNKILDPMQRPLIAWLIENYLIPQSREDLEMDGIYKGQRKEPEAGVAGDSTEIMDGIEMALNTMDADPNLDFDYITMGALPPVPKDFVTYVENFVKAIPERYRYLEMTLNMSRTNRDIFKQGMRDKYNVYYDQATNMLSLMNFQNINVQGRASMMNVNKIWCTTKDNLLVPTKGFSNSSVFDLQKFDRSVKFLSDWHIGCGFLQPEKIFATEQV